MANDSTFILYYMQSSWCLTDCKCDWQCSAECHSTKLYFAECCYDGWHYAGQLGTLNWTFIIYSCSAECHSPKLYFAECSCAECHYAEYCGSFYTYPMKITQTPYLIKYSFH